jgi:hypothetical protein
VAISAAPQTRTKMRFIRIVLQNVRQIPVSATAVPQVQTQLHRADGANSRKSVILTLPVVHSDLWLR